MRNTHKTDANANWIKVLPEDELPSGTSGVVSVGNDSILLLRHRDQICAVESKCPHMRGPLDKGKVTEDGAIVCPWHHSSFDLRGGEVKAWSTWPPGAGRVLGAVRRKRALRVFPIRVEEQSIWVAL